MLPSVDSEADRGRGREFDRGRGSEPALAEAGGTGVAGYGEPTAGRDGASEAREEDGVTGSGPSEASDSAEADRTEAAEVGVGTGVGTGVGMASAEEGVGGARACVVLSGFAVPAVVAMPGQGPPEEGKHAPRLPETSAEWKSSGSIWGEEREMGDDTETGMETEMEDNTETDNTETKMGGYTETETEM